MKAKNPFWKHDKNKKTFPKIMRPILTCFVLFFFHLTESYYTDVSLMRCNIAMPEITLGIEMTFINPFMKEFVH